MSSWPFLVLSFWIPFLFDMYADKNSSQKSFWIIWATLVVVGGIVMLNWVTQKMKTKAETQDPSGIELAPMKQLKQPLNS